MPGKRGVSYRKQCPCCSCKVENGIRVCGCGYEFYERYTTDGSGRRGPRNGAAKLKESDVREIRRRHLPYINTRQLAAEFKLNKRTITAISSGDAWGWLDQETTNGRR